jgi:hypothetical protein
MKLDAWLLKKSSMVKDFFFIIKTYASFLQSFSKDIIGETAFSHNFTVDKTGKSQGVEPD